MNIVALTDIGNVRDVNQDYVSYYKKDEENAIAVLCDGMGGHQAGEVASYLACQKVIEHYQNSSVNNDEKEIKQWIEEAISLAHHEILEKGNHDIHLEGMGTTIVVAIMIKELVYIGHVGDSRAYYYDGESLTQLTKDDTLVNALVETGSISQDDAKHHPKRNVLLQAVGVNDDVIVSFTSHTLTSGLILLCSDGLYNSLTDEEIIDVLKEKQDLDHLSQDLILKANQLGGLDNIGVVLMMNKGDGE